MKLINFNWKNTRYIDDDVMNGEIRLSRNEYNKVLDLLCFEHASAVVNHHTDASYRLRLALLHADAVIPDINVVFYLGVTATKLIVDTYNLPRYKHQNYQFRISQQTHE